MVVSSTNWMVPPGTAPPCAVSTSAVRVTLLPSPAGLADDISVTLVGSSMTVDCAMAVSADNSDSSRARKLQSHGICNFQRRVDAEQAALRPLRRSELSNAEAAN